MPIATTDEQRAVGAAVRAWAPARPSRWPPRVRRRTDPTPGASTGPTSPGSASSRPQFPRRPGEPAVRWPTWPCSLEQCADALVPGPVVTTALAAVLLARSGSALAGSVADGSRPVGLGLGDR